MISLLLTMYGAAFASDLVNAENEDGFEFTVALGAEFGDQAFSSCTGSLITPQIILTAAHCGADFDIDLVVQLGRAFFGSSVGDAQSIGFSDGLFHPDYVELSNGLGGTLGKNDIGILVLEEPVDFVEPVWIATESISDIAEGKTVTSIGFGVTETGGGSGIKRSAELTVDAVDETFIYSSSSTNENSANVCSGDSGGPQVYWDGEKWIQWAVHSWADQDCVAQSGSTRVDTVSEWILDQVEDVHGTRDRCEAWGLYGDGACDLDCDQDVDCLSDSSDLPGLDSSDESSGGCSAVSRRTDSLAGALLILVACLTSRRRNDR
jgi:secreted trypsin-like serine protease